MALRGPKTSPPPPFSRTAPTRLGARRLGDSELDSRLPRKCGPDFGQQLLAALTAHREARSPGRCVAASLRLSLFFGLSGVERARRCFFSLLCSLFLSFFESSRVEWSERDISRARRFLMCVCFRVQRRYRVLKHGGGGLKMNASLCFRFKGGMGLKTWGGRAQNECSPIWPDGFSFWFLQPL